MFIKNLFKKSIQTIKSYFSEGYEKLPKSQSYNDHHNVCSSENIYTDFVDHWEATDRIMTLQYENDTNDMKQNKPFTLINHHEIPRRKQRTHEEASKKERDEKKILVTNRLRELEKLEINNIDQILDIHEVIYIYSRLTCPIYCEMVEKLFMEMYSELFNLHRSSNSTPKRTSIRV
ncbi:uncharacterized protein [Rutidosis leptorrhynchoides]|uniref:uncharacterized protein n=1 Tax=Rutidosis leptorrhynchoides TaxID=125765 RepID=UPI003A9A3D45